jgi:DNA-binding MarR family transcriptional regulator
MPPRVRPAATAPEHRAKNGCPSEHQIATNLVEVQRLLQCRFPEQHSRELSLILVSYLAQEKGDLISVTRASAAAGLPLATSIRFAQNLEAAGIIQRFASRIDGRSTLLMLPDAAHERVGAVLAEVGRLIA